MIKVIFEDNHIIVVEKGINVPVQEDDSKDLDLLTLIKEYLKNKYNKPGNVYLGLVHRLDRPVGGVMVFAKTSKAASRLSNQIRNREMTKKYYAIVLNKLEKESDVLIDKILKDSKTNIVSISDKGKEARLSYQLIQYKDNLNLVDINLETGRSHQIRIQFASRNHPLYGDQKYNKEANTGEQIALYAYYLSFVHPVTKEKLVFELPKPNTKPWNLFK